jgi:D-alanyl-D-alanine carboxypeptidase
MLQNFSKISRPKRILIPLILVCIANFSAAQTINPVIADRLQEKMDSLKIAHNIMGISAGIIHPGQGIWKGTTGLSFGTVPIRSEMEFGIGSNTKLFTAVTLLKLAENNILSLDDSLHEWLPAFVNIDSNITIRQLLNHTSGLADYNNIVGYPDSILANPNRVFVPNELLKWVGVPLFEAGTGWNYSNTNYLLAGMVAESATGMNIAQLIRQNILNPLQLDSTFFDVQETVQGLIAHPWQMGMNINSIPRKSLNSAAYSAGAMYSTTNEMLQWYQKLFGGLVLNSSSLSLMTTFAGSGNYGVGISKIVVGGRTCFIHGGSIRGYTSFMLYDSSSKAVVSVLTNSNPAPAKLVAESLLLTLMNNPLTVSDLSLSIQAITIYPNPTNTTLFIKTENQISHQYQITNSIGQTMKQDKLIGNGVDVSSLPKGLYFIQLKDNKGKVCISKFVKN